MALQTHRAGWKSRGWMSFTVATGTVLHLGGSSQTAPTSYLSGGVSSGGFLATGIPQNGGKTRFADVAIDSDVNGHSIKHASITIVSDTSATPDARVMTDGSTPTTSLGAQHFVSDVIDIFNSRDEIFSFKLFNRSAGNMVVEVEVFE